MYLESQKVIQYELGGDSGEINLVDRAGLSSSSGPATEVIQTLSDECSSSKSIMGKSTKGGCPSKEGGVVNKWGCNPLPALIQAGLVGSNSTM